MVEYRGGNGVVKRYRREMDTLSQKMVMLVLGYDTSDHKCDIPHPFREAALQLYCTCKGFGWLADVWIMCYMECEYDDWCGTCDIFGREVGPTYFFYGELSGYCYNREDYIVGNHFYHIMPYSNLGFLIVNGKVYESPEDGVPRGMANDVLGQWKDKDRVSCDYAHLERPHGRLLVRMKMEDYPRYCFSLPDELVLEKEEFRQNRWAPKWIE